MGVGLIMNPQFDDQIADDENNNETLQRYQQPRSLDELVTRTKFTRKEIQLIYQGFKQECPSGLISENTLKKIYRQFFPLATSTIYAHILFSTCHLHTFEDLLVCLSTLCRGTMEDRLQWIFTLYDRKKNGRLTKDDFYQIIRAVYSLVGQFSSREMMHQIILEHASDTFEKLDRCQQGYITIEDFRSFCLEDPVIFQSIEALCQGNILIY